MTRQDHRQTKIEEEQARLGQQLDAVKGTVQVVQETACREVMEVDLR